MNILVLGTDIVEQKIISLCLKSRYISKIYTASDSPLIDIPNIEYLEFAELCNKCKALQIDIIINVNKKNVENGLVEYFKKHLLNIISVNQKWLNLETSRLAAKQLLSYYSVNTPKIIKAPLAFPIVVKTDKPGIDKIASTMQELVEITENSTSGCKTYMEELLNGKIIEILTLWDGKNLLAFPPQNLTEVQTDRLELYITKLNFMLADEKADFVGLFATKLIWSKNDWYVLDYIMCPDNKTDLSLIKKDFVYLLNAAIYQKLNEINNLDF